MLCVSELPRGGRRGLQHQTRWWFRGRYPYNVSTSFTRQIGSVNASGADSFPCHSEDNVCQPPTGVWKGPASPVLNKKQKDESPMHQAPSAKLQRSPPFGIIPCATLLISNEVFCSVSILVAMVVLHSAGCSSLSRVSPELPCGRSDRKASHLKSKWVECWTELTFLNA